MYTTSMSVVKTIRADIKIKTALHDITPVSHSHDIVSNAHERASRAHDYLSLGNKINKNTLIKQ